MVYSLVLLVVVGIAVVVVVVVVVDDDDCLLRASCARIARCCNALPSALKGIAFRKDQRKCHM